MKIKFIKVDNFKSLVNFELPLAKFSCLVGKGKNGATQAIRLFDIPSMREKLTVMGAGEVYEDTLLTQLDREITGNF